MLLKCCTQYASKFGKLSSSHRAGKVQVSFQSHKRQCKRIFKLPLNCAHFTGYKLMLKILPASVVVVHSLSCVWLLATPWTAARLASLSFTISQSLLRLMSIEFVMPSNHLVLCCSHSLTLYNLAAVSRLTTGSPKVSTVLLWCALDSPWHWLCWRLLLEAAPPSEPARCFLSLVLPLCLHPACFLAFSNPFLPKGGPLCSLQSLF